MGEEITLIAFHQKDAKALYLNSLALFLIADCVNNPDRGNVCVFISKAEHGCIEID